MTTASPAASRTGPAMRAVNIGLVLLLCCYAWFLAGTLMRRMPLLLDFSVFWTAGRLVWRGQAALAYDWRVFDPMLTFLSAKRPADIGPWFYPPMFFLAVAPLGLLPLPVAAGAWIATTAAALLAAVRAIVPRTAVLLATLAAPPVFFNFCSGQNGLLSGALLGGGLTLIDRRPLLSGALLGALAYKPQFGVVLPVVLAAAGRWRVIAGAAATALALGAIAGVLFGWDTYRAFFGELFFARTHLLGGGLEWNRLESFYGMLRTIGLGGTTAWLVHGGTALAAVAATCAIWRSATAPALQAASLATASFLASPYSEINDMAILVVPMAFLLRHAQEHGFRAWEPPLLVFAYFTPLIFLFVPFIHTLSGMGPFICAALIAIIGLRLGAGERRRSLAAAA